MTTESNLSGPHPFSGNQAEFSRMLDSVGWALFLVWVGIAFLADIGWGWGLVGVAAIVLGEAHRLRIGVRGGPRPGR